SAQIREILISESAWEEMTCLFAPSLGMRPSLNHASTALPVRFYINLLGNDRIIASDQRKNKPEPF
ncbi:hypothetical protein KE273_22665, partial [Klebsiella sp. MC1F]|nr:hypothetical protein [Klebsiella sp. MC1F]MBT0595714.1 hypothetical protein [Klebsiella quasipneumoniae]